MCPQPSPHLLALSARIIGLLLVIRMVLAFAVHQVIGYLLFRDNR